MLLSIPKGLVKQLRTAGHAEMADHLKNLGAAANRKPTLRLRAVGNSHLGTARVCQPNQLGLAIAAAIEQAQKMLSRS
jgi:hypothetical protein